MNVHIITMVAIRESYSNGIVRFPGSYGPDCSVKNRTWCRVIVRQFSALGRRSAAVLVDRVQYCGQKLAKRTGYEPRYSTMRLQAKS